jgi:hypothetical protein
VHCQVPLKEASNIPKRGLFEPPPLRDDAKAALDDITKVLKPRRKCGIGHKPFDGDNLLQERLEMMKMFLWNYVNPLNSFGWMAASLTTAQANQCGTRTARNLRKWVRAFIGDREAMPFTLYGTWNVSMLKKGELAKELHEHLQSLGKYVVAMDIVRYLDQPDVQKEHGLKSSISLATAQSWMSTMHYRWSKTPKGMYVDGHERPDVVAYRQDKFLPTIAELEQNVRVWNNGSFQMRDDAPNPERPTCLWLQDESTFFGNDTDESGWHHTDENPQPRPKGPGLSLMVSDFVSADHGWLRDTSGTSEGEARVLFDAGKNTEGYFINDDHREQLAKAMVIAKRQWPNEDHVFIYDNARTHTKRPDDALSARRMPKGPSPVFGIDRVVKDAKGQPVKGLNGLVVKERVRMADTHFKGRPQSLYFPNDDAKYPGYFKGMVALLEERGYSNVKALKRECPGFKCPQGQTRCCCRRWLFTEDDFENVESLLERDGKANGCRVIFLPKFHCELNFIEQVWCKAKYFFRRQPRASKKDELRSKVITSLEQVDLEQMRR